MYINTCIYMQTSPKCIHMRMSEDVYRMYVCMYACMYVRVNICSTPIHLYIYIYIYVYILVRIHTYRHTCTHRYTCIYRVLQFNPNFGTLGHSPLASRGRAPGAGGPGAGRGGRRRPGGPFKNIQGAPYALIQEYGLNYIGVHNGI